MGICHSASQQKKKKEKKCDPWEGEGSRAPAWVEFPGTPTYTYVHLCKRTYTYVHECTRTYTKVHICTRTYAHVHIRTRTYTHVHARTRTYVSPGILLSLGPLPPEGRRFFFLFLLAGWLVELAGLDGSAGWPSLSGNAPTVRSINKIITLIILHSCQKMNNITIISIISPI